MKTHELKTHPLPFAAVKRGDKTFEFRKDDRGFAVGDRLVLREWNPKVKENEVCVGAYTGDSEDFIITYKLTGRFGVPDGYCVLGMRSDSLSTREALSQAAEIDELKDQVSDLERSNEELRDLVSAYEAEDERTPNIDAAAFAQFPSLDRDQILADLKREVLAVGGAWP